MLGHLVRVAQPALLVVTTVHGAVRDHAHLERCEHLFGDVARRADDDVGHMAAGEHLGRVRARVRIRVRDGVRARGGVKARDGLG